MNTITIELCKEDRDRLDAIIEALKHTHHCDCAEQATEAPELPQKPAEEPAQLVTPPQTEQPEKQAPAPSESAQAPTVDRSEVQRKVVELSAAGKKAEVKDIVMAYADRVSAIPEDKLAEVYEKLSALEG